MAWNQMNLPAAAARFRRAPLAFPSVITYAEGNPAATTPFGSGRAILFLIDEIYSISNGGTERQVLQMVDLARRLGYRPHLAVLRGTRWLSEEEIGCPIYRSGVESFFSLETWKAIFRLVGFMRTEKFSLVQTFFIESNILGPCLARIAGVPVVISSRRNLNHWMGPFALWLQRLANLCTDCVVANSGVALQAIAVQERVARHKLQVAYNGIDLARFAELHRDRVHARAMLGVSDDQILVGNISCFRAVKGLAQFVAAARIVLEHDQRMKFLIVGDGEEKSAVMQQIRQYRLEDHIHLAGAQADVLPYLAAMDIGVLSSLSEGFSNSLLEYMASGLPSVATEVGGNREALGIAGEKEPGCEAGIGVPPNDPAALAQAILRLRCTELRKEMGAAALRQVQRFSLERAAQRMEELYGELLSAKEGKRRGI